MSPATNVHQAYGGPASISAALRIENERVVGSVRAEATCDQHFAIGQDSCGVTAQGQRECGGGRPCAGVGIEQLCAVEEGVGAETADDQDSPILQQSGLMLGATNVH